MKWLIDWLVVTLAPSRGGGDHERSWEGGEEGAVGRAEAEEEEEKGRWSSCGHVDSMDQSVLTICQRLLATHFLSVFRFVILGERKKRCLEYNLQVRKKLNVNVINLMGLASRDNEKARRDFKN